MEVTRTMEKMGRVLLVSNRLPVTVAVEEGRATMVPSSGGLATALRAWHQMAGGCWVGWPGILGHLSADDRTTIDAALESDSLATVELTEREIGGFYETFSNSVIWPLFHYMLDRVPLDNHEWATYVSVNEKFAEAVVSRYQPGDVIWVHDYQLMLVPALVRARLPHAKIGFFLHIPFPSSEIFRTLPWRAEILEGLLGADLIGFHTYGYVRHFSMSVLHVLGIEPDVDCVRCDAREVKLKALPIGMDAAAFAALAATPAVQQEAANIRRDAGGRQILLGVDRLDYTKGLPRRLLAFQALLEQAEWRDRVRLIQIAIPTRRGVESYRGFRQSVEELAGRINGECGTVGAVPLHYLYGTVSLPRLVALYLAADVMVVTPLRDGLNLVAKEFVASRIDNDGVLILSEFTGAASELGESLTVNPYDVAGLTAAMSRGLSMTASERTARMTALRARVSSNTIDRWAGSFIAAVHGASVIPAIRSRAVDVETLQRALAPVLSATALTMVLDFDGTLVPIADSPALSQPDEALLRLLRGLADRSRTEVHVISGRGCDSLERWLGHLPVTLWAEHGFWRRPPGGLWQAAGVPPEGWRNKVIPILEHFTAATPGSWIEEKRASVSWHYRLADVTFGAHQAHELRMLFGDALSNQPLEVREGKKVLEIRLRGVHKGHAVHRILDAAPPGSGTIAVGDDATDEDMFAALPQVQPSASIHVGSGPSNAQYWLADPAALREWLQLLAP